MKTKVIHTKIKEVPQKCNLILGLHSVLFSIFAASDNFFLTKCKKLMIVFQNREHDIFPKTLDDTG